MHRQLVLIVSLAVMGTAAAHAAPMTSFWTHTHRMGIGEYFTGSWDAPTGGALNLSCRDDGSASIMTQINGEPPPGNGELLLTTSSRKHAHEGHFPTGADGSVRIASVVSSSAFNALWDALRRDDIVTLRFPDGRMSVQSLVGAARTLPPKPCG